MDTAPQEAQLAPAAPPEPSLEQHVTVEAQAQAARQTTQPDANAPVHAHDFASSESIAGAVLGLDPAAANAAREAYEADRRAEARKYELKQGSFLILASLVAAQPDTPVAILAGKSVVAAEALLDRLDR